MSFIYKGSCNCNHAAITLTLPQPLSHYSARACDCDFCILHGIQYLSDPAGKLWISSLQKLHALKQGSEQAEFLTCPQCKQVLAASATIFGELKGAVNAYCLNEADSLNKPITVSPKQLAPDEKQARWYQIWCDLTFELAG